MSATASLRRSSSSSQKAARENARLPVSALLVGDKLAQNDPQRAPVLAYIKAYEAKHNQPVSGFGGFMHDGFMMVVEAIRRAKSSEPAKIRAELEATKNYVGVNGIYNMTPADHMGLDLAGISYCRDQRWKLVSCSSGKLTGTTGFSV
jgi:branched-chain amino acid transport system substrate-binding protein